MSKGATPTNAEEPLLGPGPVGGSPAQPDSYRRSGILGSLKNAVKPLKHPEKRKERLIEGAKTGNLEMVKQALNDGADINATLFDTRRFINSGLTPLHHASLEGHLKVVRELLSGEGHQGATVDARDITGYTPLYAASMRGHLDVVRELLSGEGHQGADANLANVHGHTPLYAASQYGHLEVVRELLSGEGHQGAAVSIDSLNIAKTPEIKALLEQAMGGAPASGGGRRRYTHTRRQRHTKRTRRTKRKNKKTRRH